MKRKINNKRFTIRLVLCMKHLGITTVGQAYKYLCDCEDKTILNTSVKTLYIEIYNYVIIQRLVTPK